MDELNIPSDEPLAMPFYDVWTLALTSPTLETYKKLLADPGANALKAGIWVGITALISNIITVLMQKLFGTSIFQQLEQIAQQTGSRPLPTELGWTYLLCVIPVAALATILGLGINAFLIKLVGGMLGGTGTSGEIFYIMGTFIAPLAIFSGLIGSLPYLNILGGSLIGLYSLYLTVLAINAAHKFSWGRAIGTLAILIAAEILLGCLLGGCLMIAFGAAMAQ